jgi:hypothetical protein
LRLNSEFLSNPPIPLSFAKAQASKAIAVTSAFSKCLSNPPLNLKIGPKSKVKKRKIGDNLQNGRENTSHEYYYRHCYICGVSGFTAMPAG